MGKFKGDWDSGLLPELFPLALLAVQIYVHLFCVFLGGWGWERGYSVAFSKHVGKFKGDWSSGLLSELFPLAFWGVRGGERG